MVSFVNEPFRPKMKVKLAAKQATMEKEWRFLKNLKIERPYVSAISLLGIYPKKTNIT